MISGIRSKIYCSHLFTILQLLKLFIVLCLIWNAQMPNGRFYLNESRKISFVKGNKIQLFLHLVGGEFKDSKTVARVRLGQKAVLECAPRGDQPIRLSWTRHGNKITTQHQNYFKVSCQSAKKLMNWGWNLNYPHLAYFWEILILWTIGYYKKVKSV